MKMFFDWLKRLFSDAELNKAYYTLASCRKELASCQKIRQLLARDYAITLNTLDLNQIEADIFQQALTNTFSQEQINQFFDNADRIRKEHNENSRRISN